MARFLFLWSTSEVPGPIASPPAGHEIVTLDQYAFDGLSDDALAEFDGLILSTHADQQHLMEHGRRLDAFLDARSILVNGPATSAFLPELSGPFAPLAERNIATLTVAIPAGPSFLEGVEACDLTYRRGVAGFWGRGCQTPPAGAEVLTTLGPDRIPFDWTIVRPGGGRLFVHPGNDVWSFAGGKTSADRLWPQLLDWMGSRP